MSDDHITVARTPPDFAEEFRGPRMPRLRPVDTMPTPNGWALPRRLAIRLGACARCGAAPADRFTDAVSEQEYALSGMCQRCQDGLYGG